MYILKKKTKKTMRFIQYNTPLKQSFPWEYELNDKYKFFANGGIYSNIQYT